MAFHEVLFPVGISYGAIGGPRFSTTLVELKSGFEQRNIDWTQARLEWNITQGLKDLSDAATLVAFFRAREGRGHGFRYFDHLDFEILGPQTIGTGDAAKTVFQIFKRYTSGSIDYDRTIKKLVTGKTRVFLDAVEQFSGFTVQDNAGTVTFSSPPGGGVIVAILTEFHTPVRFNVDHLAMEIAFFDLINWPQITVKEVRIT